MAGGKQLLRRVNSANAGQSTSAANTAHNVFLQLRLEPFLSSSLLDLLDILAYPVTISPSLPNTPPPTYEPPPPSYPSSDTWSISTISLNLLAEAAPARIESEEPSAPASGTAASTEDAGGERELQSQLVLNLLMYEILAHQSSVSGACPPTDPPPAATRVMPSSDQLE
ncbi:hypothetical protein GQ54DRAFT_297337 [Martensiomyces pterosporus]|nr:hypothetical protein GQ54DRAFT_297337 [Martensiomyces pterosporus]